MKPFIYRTYVGAVTALVLGAPLAYAQEALRDPTVAPGETGASPASAAGEEGMTVLVRDDRPFLMVGSRLYAPGDKIGNLRLERIAEKEVWFHDGTALIKVPRFAGIARKALAAKPSCKTPLKSPTRATAACDETQP